MRECWNWQTGTFEVRVSTTYGFKSRLAHQRQVAAPKSRISLCGVREEYIAVDYSPLYRKYVFYYGGQKNYFQPLFDMYEEGVFVKK